MSNVPMTRPDEMLAVHENMYAPGFAELDDGRVLSFARYEAATPGEEQTRFSISEDGGLTWSAPFDRKDANGDPVGGGEQGATSLVKLSGRGVGLASNVRTPGDMHALFWRSEDGGETWVAPVRMTPRNMDAIFVSTDVMMRTSSGRIIMPVYTSLGQRSRPDERFPTLPGKLVNGQYLTASGHFFDPGFSAVYVCYSDDDGRTWQRNSDGELVINLDWNATFSYVNEPSVAEVSPGRLLIMLRTGLGRLYQAWSDDDGETWGRPQPTSLAASTTPAYIASIPPTGHLLVVWNQESEEEVKHSYPRSRMSAAISRNGGSVWEFFQNVESMHEATRVEPGPIRPLRPAEYYYAAGMPAPEREAEYISTATRESPWAWRITYPGVFVTGDRVFVHYRHMVCEEHPTRAEIMQRKITRFKVLPLTWFYGGKEPADNPVLPRAWTPAGE